MIPAFVQCCPAVLRTTSPCLAFLQAGDHVLHINGESTQGLTHAQVVERIRSGGPRLHLVLRRPLEPQPGKLEGVGRAPEGK
jgi:C-terminal processing protease CtpA/Prc